MVPDTPHSDRLDSALREAPSPHLNTESIDGEIIVWYDLGRDDPDALVEYVERYTRLFYQGEKSPDGHNTAGLRFAR